jgi:FixJ family two-component response regulator
MTSESTSVMEPSVCLIDADPAVRDSLRSLAALYGQPVRCYSTARTFLDDLVHLPVRCVVCEARLPDERGIEVYLTMIERGYRVPFALLVSRDFGQMQTEATYFGINLVIQKPILEVQALIDFIRQHPRIAHGAPGDY